MDKETLEQFKQQLLARQVESQEQEAVYTRCPQCVGKQMRGFLFLFLAIISIFAFNLIPNRSEASRFPTSLSYRRSLLNGPQVRHPNPSGPRRRIRSSLRRDSAPPSPMYTTIQPVMRGVGARTEDQKWLLKQTSSSSSSVRLLPKHDGAHRGQVLGNQHPNVYIGNPEEIGREAALFEHKGRRFKLRGEYDLDDRTFAYTEIFDTRLQKWRQMEDSDHLLMSQARKVSTIPNVSHPP